MRPQAKPDTTVHSAILYALMVAYPLFAVSAHAGSMGSNPGGKWATGSVAEDPAKRATRSTATDRAVPVADFGAFPGDGACDAEAITDAVTYARNTGARTVVFERGVYNLRHRKHFSPTIQLKDLQDVTLSGAIGDAGEPATVLELNLPLKNGFGVRHLAAQNCSNLVLENLVFDLAPRYTTSAKVIHVDREQQFVEVEMLPGQTHFEGMKCYSANAWDLQTRELLPVNALTINMQEAYFDNLWQRTDHPNTVRYAIRNMPFAATVNVGDGISWHFSARTTQGFTLAFSDIAGLSLRNLRIHNSITLSVKIYDSRDVSITDVRIEPTGNSLAVGPRDGIHISNARGRLLVDNLRVKGVRWDPFVSRVNFMTVREVRGKVLECIYSVVGNPDTLVQAGDVLDFWSGDRPFRMEVAQVTVLSRRGDKRLRLEFEADIPATVRTGSLVSPPTWDEAVIRNSSFEGNFGTPIVYENSNLLLENNVFRNNSYGAVGIGPTSLNTGAFGHNIVIRNNLFADSGWVSKYGGGCGVIAIFESHPEFKHEAYNTRIVIENNTFANRTLPGECPAILVRNAADVDIRGNMFEGFTRTVVLDPQTTARINFQE
jgi:hypothetical protein